jgi:type II secretory pathway pseudopilin PulG
MKSVDRQAAVDNTRPTTTGDEGYMLLALVVAIALILLALSVAAADVAFSLRREREEESVRRANQFVRAIQLYYKKFNHYPGSLEQLEKTNNIRYLRQRYIDPLTGKDDWRLIPPGQNVTTVKGFFGEELEGMASGGLGAAAGMQAGGMGGGNAAGGTSGTAGASGTSGSTGFGFGNASGSDSSSTSGSGSGLGSAAGMRSQGMGSSSSSGPLMGVGSSATGKSILVLNEQTTYETWEFLYDPRIEKLKVAAQMNNGGADGLGGISGQSAGSFGQSSGSLGQSQSGTTTNSGGTTTSTSP